MMDLDRAQRIANEVSKRLSPYCKKKADGAPYIEVAGSVRRKKPQVRDIDFVLVPSDPWNLHHEIGGMGQVRMSGMKIMRVMAGSVQVDLYIADEKTWATLLLIRTGSAENNKRLCFRANNALGLPWQRPEERG